jgi:hypothetical protein
MESEAGGQLLMVTVYYALGKVEFGETIISFWTKPDKSDLFKEKFGIISEERMKFRVGYKLKIWNFTLEEVKKWN